MLVAIANGLEAIHSNGLFLQELTPDKIIIGKDCRVKIGDLSFARIGEQTEHKMLKVNPIVESKVNTPENGDLAFMSPEALLNNW